MTILKIIPVLAIILIDGIAGVAVAGIADIVDVAGWVAGLAFAELVQVFSYANNKHLAFEMKHFIRLIGWVAKEEADDATDDFTRRSEYYAFLAGAAVGTAASLSCSPSSGIGLLRYLPG